VPENHDPMTTTLEALRSDVERTPLADSLAVRRRGDQRTRRQAVGGALVVAVLVAGAVGYLTGGLTGDNKGLPPATDRPTATTSVERTYALTDQPLLKPANMPTVGPYGGWQASQDPAGLENQPSLCVPSPSDLAALETQSVLLYTELDAQAQEHVLRFSDEREAESAFLTLERSFAECSPGDPAEATVKDRGPTEGASLNNVDTTLHASRLTTPVADAGISYYELGVAQVANVLVVLQWSSMGKPEGVDWVLSNELLGVAAATAAWPVH
jgi:hypothetical protein